MWLLHSRGLFLERFENFLGDINLFVSSKRMRFKLWNLAVINFAFLFIWKISKEQLFIKANHSFKNCFLCPISYWVFWEMAPRAQSLEGNNYNTNLLFLKEMKFLCFKNNVIFCWKETNINPDNCGKSSFIGKRGLAPI